MPQGRPELQAKFKHDGNADAVLIKAGYRYDHSRFTYYIPKNHKPTPEECDAIEYLQDEWDYGVEHEK